MQQVRYSPTRSSNSMIAGGHPVADHFGFHGRPFPLIFRTTNLTAIGRSPQVKGQSLPGTGPFPSRLTIGCRLADNKTVTTDSNTGTVIRGSLGLRYPDGSEQRFKLPATANFRPGDRANIATVYDRRIYIFWLRRVKGGWEVE